MKNFRVGNLFALSALAINVVTLYNSLPPEMKAKVKDHLNGFVDQAKGGALKAAEVYHSEMAILNEEIEELKAELVKYKKKFVADLGDAKAVFDEEMEKSAESRKEAEKEAEEFSEKVANFTENVADFAEKSATDPDFVDDLDEDRNENGF